MAVLTWVSCYQGRGCWRGADGHARVDVGLLGFFVFCLLCGRLRGVMVERERERASAWVR